MSNNDTIKELTNNINILLNDTSLLNNGIKWEVCSIMTLKWVIIMVEKWVIMTNHIKIGLYDTSFINNDI